MIRAGFTHGRAAFFRVAAPAGPGVPALPDDGRVTEAVGAAAPVVAVLEAAGAVVEAAGAADAAVGVAEPAEAVAAAVEAALPEAGAPPMRVLAGAGAPPIRFFGGAASPVPVAGASGAGADGVVA
ncbi:hypothetical protein C8E99_2797 [Citricoccus muralis]|uniref:Uncharacterized protein n=1 Tax=Citricoccus muralis TaxID=169134 RepID=A0A3D9LES9_9MICC|nr:hypothetical protein C8E99_2797 [Citricoccus muralis]